MPGVRGRPVRRPARSPRLEQTACAAAAASRGTARAGTALPTCWAPEPQQGLVAATGSSPMFVCHHVRRGAPETALNPFPLPKQTSEKQTALHFTGTQWQSVLHLLKWPHLSKSIPVCKIHIQNTTAKQIIYIQGSCNIKQ